VRELFIWYRVPAVRAKTTRLAVLVMQRALMAAWPGLEARLLVRDQAEPQTWMETYARRAASPASSAGIDGALEAAIESAARHLGAAIDGDRHAELFDVVGPSGI
jgi:hypothetical protein